MRKHKQKNKPKPYTLSNLSKLNNFKSQKRKHTQTHTQTKVNKNKTKQKQITRQAKQNKKRTNKNRTIWENMSLKSNQGGSSISETTWAIFCDPPPPFDLGGEGMTPPGAKMLKQQPLHDKRSVETSHF